MLSETDIVSSLSVCMCAEIRAYAYAKIEYVRIRTENTIQKIEYVYDTWYVCSNFGMCVSTQKLEITGSADLL